MHADYHTTASFAASSYRSALDSVAAAGLSANASGGGSGAYGSANSGGISNGGGGSAYGASLPHGSRRADGGGANINGSMNTASAAAAASTASTAPAAASAAAAVNTSSHQVVLTVRSPSSRLSDGSSRRSRSGEASEVHSNPVFGLAVPPDGTTPADGGAAAAKRGFAHRSAVPSDGAAAAAEQGLGLDSATAAGASAGNASTRGAVTTLSASLHIPHLSLTGRSGSGSQPAGPGQGQPMIFTAYAAGGVCEEDDIGGTGGGGGKGGGFAGQGDVKGLEEPHHVETWEGWRERARTQGRLWLLCEPSDVLKVGAWSG